MAQSIYVLFMGKTTEAWHQLSEDEQRSLFDKVQAALEQAGGKNIIGCDSTWASEQWQFFGVHEFPDIEAVQKNTAALQKLNWFRYVDSVTTWARSSQCDVLRSTVQSNGHVHSQTWPFVFWRPGCPRRP